MNTEERLGSWKEIGAYLQRDARTARRWEKEEGLPVHRHSHKSRSSVYAYPSEIDAWRASRKVVAEPPPPVPLWRSLFAPSRSLAFGMTMLACLIMVGNGVRRASAQTRQAARQVWVGKGGEVDTQGSVSSDGRFLSFVDTATGDLAIRNLETGENRRLTDNGNTDWLHFAVTSVVSPDGRQVAYTWFYTDEEGQEDLRVISAAGGKVAPRVIYQNKDAGARPFGWLADGSGVFATLSRRDRTRQIALIRTDGGVTILKSFDWRASNKLAVSPDGRYIAYDFPASEEKPEHDIYILAADGSGEVRAVQNPADDLVVGWTPDGKALLFTSDRTGSVGLWSITVTGGKPKGQATLLKRDMGRITPLGLSSDGTLYYGAVAGIRDVYMLSIDPQTRKPVSEPVLVAQRSLGTHAGADWSPDGKYLAYPSRGQRGSQGPAILTIHSVVDGSERDVVTKLAYIEAYAGIRWPLDGQFIFVQGVDPRGQEGLYKVDVQNGETQSVVRGNSSRQALSTDGRILYYHMFGPGKWPQDVKIMARDTRDNTERELYTLLGGYLRFLAISPDGKNLALTENPDEHSKTQHILVRPMDGGKPRVLVEAPVIADSGSAFFEWTRDGEAILFAKPGLELWRVNARTGEQFLVCKCPTDGAGMLRHIRLSPDGRQLSYTYGRGSREVWALENFLPKLAAEK